MANYSDQEALLLKREDEQISCVLLKSSATWILKITMWVIFIAWATFIFLFPSNFVTQLYLKFIQASQGTIFGATGRVFLLFSAPILVISCLAILYIAISVEEGVHGRKDSKPPRFRLGTFPVVVDGPFGVVSAGEMIVIIIFLVYIIWASIIYTINNFDLLPKYEAAGLEASMLMLTGLRFGAMGLYFAAFLFVPVARGSILLRLINIPFEDAARYHVWLGHLTMFFFTLHALCYIIAWKMHGHLLPKLMEWTNNSPANLPGVIALLAGLLMWVTSLPQVRRMHFALFFYTHQLYVVFLVFLALHVGDAIFSIAAAGIFLFMLDRFLRFCQSRKTVDDVVSATLELALGYENLILVAGGVGISPFLAILSDILHRLKDGKPCFPKNILIIWEVKKTNELPLLQTVDIESICPSFSDKLNLEIQTYVTTQSEPSPESGNIENISSSKGFRVSALVGTRSVLWSGLYLVVSTIGLVITVGILNIFYINPFNITYWWYKGLLFVACMIISVVVFGGVVIALWHLWETKKKSEDSANVPQNRDHPTRNTTGQEQYATSILYGQKPDFGGIFGSMAERWGNVDIGVIVCGPAPTLQTSVAKECRTHNFTRKSNQPIFHFHNHGFDLFCREEEADDTATNN